MAQSSPNVSCVCSLIIIYDISYSYHVGSDSALVKDIEVICQHQFKDNIHKFKAYSIHCLASMMLLTSNNMLALRYEPLNIMPDAFRSHELVSSSSGQVTNINASTLAFTPCRVSICLNLFNLLQMQTDKQRQLNKPANSLPLILSIFKDYEWLQS